MNENIKKTRVNIDGVHSLDITINETKRTVVAVLISVGDQPELIYAEKFDFSCNYLKEAIKIGIKYLDGTNKPENNLHIQSIKSKHIRTEYKT